MSQTSKCGKPKNYKNKDDSSQTLENSSQVLNDSNKKLDISDQTLDDSHQDFDESNQNLQDLSNVTEERDFEWLEFVKFVVNC